MDFTRLHLVEMNRHVYDRLPRFEDVYCSHRVAIVQELLKRLHFMVVFRHLLLELLDHLDKLLSLLVANCPFGILTALTDDGQLAVA